MTEEWTGLPDDQFVIVIGRQFGSGGRSVGKIIARRLGIDYYDTELLKKAAESEGLDPDIFKAHDEKKPSVLKALLQGAYGIPDNFHTVPISGERIYTIKSKVIKDLAGKGSCVIVGRNADVILKGHPNLFSIFLHAPIEMRAQRIMAREEAPTIEDAMAKAREQDKRRESFYNYFAGDKKWGLAHNYDLCIDTSRFSNESVADIIINYMQKRGLSLHPKE